MRGGFFTKFAALAHGGAFGLQRLTNQSLYNKILLLQKFDDIGGKVLKPKKFSLQPQKKNLRPFFIFSFF